MIVTLTIRMNICAVMHNTHIQLSPSLVEKGDLTSAYEDG